MAKLEFKNIGISGLAACVPTNKIINRQYTGFFSSEEASEIVDKTGIEERRFAPKGMTAADLCYQAADHLLERMEIDRNTIDVLLFVSQTPDYRMPASSVILQHRLQLPKSTAAFDINIGCSGFVYGLSVAYLYAQQPHVRKVLLLDGETRSRVYSPKDRKTAFIFGDAGSAALVEKNEMETSSHFNLDSDGSRSHLIKADAGGYRMPSSPETLKEKVVDEFGNMRSAEHGYMNGSDVFSFVLREIPRSFKKTLTDAGLAVEDIDQFYFHQANKFMNDFLGKKLKVDPGKAPQCLQEYGNTSSVSIPLTISSTRGDQQTRNETWMLSGFGVGMSWATAIIPTGNLRILPVLEI